MVNVIYIYGFVYLPVLWCKNGQGFEGDRVYCLECYYKIMKFVDLHLFIMMFYVILESCLAYGITNFLMLVVIS